jgi:hypothetical protein
MPEHQISQMKHKNMTRLTYTKGLSFLRCINDPQVLAGSEVSSDFRQSRYEKMTYRVTAT